MLTTRDVLAYALMKESLDDYSNFSLLASSIKRADSGVFARSEGYRVRFFNDALDDVCRAYGVKPCLADISRQPADEKVAEVMKAITSIRAKDEINTFSKLLKSMSEGSYSCLRCYVNNLITANLINDEVSVETLLTLIEESLTSIYAVPVIDIDDDIEKVKKYGIPYKPVTVRSKIAYIHIVGEALDKASALPSAECQMTDTYSKKEKSILSNLVHCTTKSHISPVSLLSVVFVSSMLGLANIIEPSRVSLMLGFILLDFSALVMVLEKFTRLCTASLSYGLLKSLSELLCLLRYMYIPLAPTMAGVLLVISYVTQYIN